jgi:hypothetical protein
LNHSVDEDVNIDVNGKLSRNFALDCFENRRTSNLKVFNSRLYCLTARLLIETMDSMHALDASLYARPVSDQSVAVKMDCPRPVAADYMY